MLGIIISTIFIALIVNLLLKKIHLPTIIGYIVTGTIIAYIFNLHSAVNNHELKEIAEFGVVFLMFTIGVEMSFDKLKQMKKEIFVIGFFQVVLTALFVFAISKFILDFSTQASLILGAALALSSTAIVLKIFNETKVINKVHGRRVLGILIMQDISVIPILLMISFFTMGEDQSIYLMIGKTTLAALVLLGLLYVCGKYLLEPFLTIVVNTKSDELFVLTVLLLAIGSSYLAHQFGFSYSLGAFIAGMMIAETKFKHQVEADLIPFRNILLGVFFITVGMQIDFMIISKHILTIAILLPLIMALKYVIIYSLIRLEDTKRVAFKTAVSLVQVGEFSLAILELSKSQNLIDATSSQILIVTIVISMILTPFILKNLSIVASKLVKEDLIMNDNNSSYVPDDLEHHIVVLGYGDFGQSIVKELKKFNENYVILENDLHFYQKGVNDNEPIIFGNAAQKHILNALSLDKASAVIVAVHNPESLHLICEAVEELNCNSKTIIALRNDTDRASIEGLHLEHIIVESEQISKAIVDEVLYCRLD